jgi:hypothetical protein
VHLIFIYTIRPFRSAVAFWWCLIKIIRQHHNVRYTEAEFMNVQFRWGFGASSWEFSDLMFPYTYNVYITNQFKTTFAQGGWGVKSVSRGDYEYQGGKLLRDFCPNYVQEFGLRTDNTLQYPLHFQELCCFYINAFSSMTGVFSI